MLPASLKRTEVRKFSTAENFILMRYKYFHEYDKSYFQRSVWNSSSRCSLLSVLPSQASLGQKGTETAIFKCCALRW